MHLLAAEAQRIDADDPVDLALEPAPIVFLSPADGEIASFAQAVARSPTGPAVRIASLAALSHPMSVDLLAQRTLTGTRVIALRVLGGEGYFAYGIETLRRHALATGATLLIVPGEPSFDPLLAARGTVPQEVARDFHAYCREGGPQNRDRALAFLRHLAGEGERPPPAVPLPAAGLYARGTLPADLSALASLGFSGTAVGLVFYRAHLLDGLAEGIDALVEGLASEGLAPVPVYANSLKDPAAGPLVRGLLNEAGCRLALTTMGFSAGGSGTPLDDGVRPVLQVVQASGAEADWREATTGLSVRDLAMSVVTGEFDGRILTRAVAFKERDARDQRTGAFPVRFEAAPDRVSFVAALSAAHAALATTPNAKKRIAIVLANYPGADGRIGNGVGLDTPASVARIIETLHGAGYEVGDAPRTGAALMAALLETRSAPTLRLSLAEYAAHFGTLSSATRSAVAGEWGDPADDPSVDAGGFGIEGLAAGNLLIAIQPTRGYERDVKATYHDPALVPTHAYLAFYRYLRAVFGAHAVVHVGKHGNMEWLPGKATALSADCFPEVAFGPMPHVYPFIVNDPGEGTQAKRRAQAAIVDHLTPPMTRAETHGAGRDLEALLDEYALARSLDPGRAERLGRTIVETAEGAGLLADLGLTAQGGTDQLLSALDTHLCDLKELQIRDGLHIFGECPTGDQRRDLLCAIARSPRGPAEADGSLMRAIAADLDLSFDPLAANPAAPWEGPRPAILSDACAGLWRTEGDTVERIEALASAVIAGAAPPGPVSTRVREAMRPVEAALARSGAAETDGLLAGLAGAFVHPGPSGAPTRGRPDVLPTGRNFTSVDVRAVPTPAAVVAGRAAADAVVERYVMDEGEWPKTLILTLWGTAAMRTGGEDLAQALALIGAEPVWDAGRVTGFTITALGALCRPRIDVTLRVSGFFRDAFPEQIALFDSAVRAIAARDEPADQNPIRVRFSSAEDGDSVSVFGAMPGAYGAGLQALIESGEWTDRTMLGEAFIAWSRFGYGKGWDGQPVDAELRQRLADVDVLVQAQDNREHDLLDSDDYYQFEGGLAAAVEAVSGRAPKSLHVDTSRPERPVARSLPEELARVVRGRAANPKWIAGVMRHGYKGAFEIAATVDYLFAFAATTNAVQDHHFDQLYDAYIDDPDVAAFIQAHNAPALAEMAARFEEAIRRGLWTPRKNSVHDRLRTLSGGSAGTEKARDAAP